MKSGPHSLTRLPTPAGLVVGCVLLALVLGGPRSLLAQATLARVEPLSANAVLESSVTFCIEGQGAGTFLYQWQKNGVNLAAQTNRCLALTNMTIADGASYR